MAKKTDIRVLEDIYPGQHEKLKTRILACMRFYAKLFELKDWRFVVGFGPLEDETEEEPTEQYAAGVHVEPEYKFASLKYNLAALSIRAEKLDSVVRHEFLHILLSPLMNVAFFLAGDDAITEEMVRVANETTTTKVEQLQFWQQLSPP